MFMLKKIIPSELNKIPYIPPGWAYGKLEHLIYIAGRIGWRGLKADEYTQDGPLLLSVYNLNKGDYVDFNDVYHISQERYDESPEIMLRENDILLTKDGAGIGKIGIVKNLPGPATVNSSLLVIRASGIFVPEFLFYLLKGPRMQDIVRARITGSATPHLFQRDIKQFTLLIPPLAEQRRIVAKIEELFTQLEAGTAALRRVQAGLKRYKASVLKAACEGRLVDQAPSDEPAVKILKRISVEKGDEALPTLIGNFPELPKGWVWARLEQISLLDVGYAFKSEEFALQGIRLLRGDNIEPGSLRWTNTRYWPEEKLNNFRHLLVKEGDIILAMDRPLISSGLKIARASNRDLPSLLVQRVARFNPIIPQMADYLFIALQTQSFINHLTKKQTGTQLPHISAKDILSFVIPLPPITEQYRIVAEVERRLSVVAKVEAAVEAGLKRAARLRQTVFKRAFEGRLVAQDPEDEPAESLLERIKQVHPRMEHEHAHGVTGRAVKQKRKGRKPGQLDLF